MQNLPEIIINITLFGTILCCAWTDLQSGKIYNKVTIPAILIGILLNSILNKKNGFFFSMEGVGFAFGVGIVFFALRVMSGGDLKLGMAIGALKGMQFYFVMLIFAALAGGVISIVYLVKRRRLAATLVGFGRMFVFRESPVSLTENTVAKMPYSIAIAIGVLMALILG